MGQFRKDLLGVLSITTHMEKPVTISLLAVPAVVDSG